MKIILFSRPQLGHTAEGIGEIFDAIARYGFDWSVNEEFAEVVERLGGPAVATRARYGSDTGDQPEASVMVCCGGDGTLLEGASRLHGRKVPVVGINAGRLGFLALAPQSETDAVFASIARGELLVDPRPMLCAEGEFNGRRQRVYALNEVSVQRLGATMISTDAAIDGEPVSTYMGDGIVVATPTGSTAYSLSAGGPVIAPSCRCTVLTPLSPHNLTMRPIVIADTSRITLRVSTRGNGASLSADNRTFSIADGSRIDIFRSERMIYLAVPHNISFFGSLRNKMMWGVDIR